MCFVRGERSLCRSMVRQKIKGTKVRRSLSPEEEPNFYMPHWGKTKSIGMNEVSPSELPSPVTTVSTVHSPKPKARTQSASSPQTKAGKNLKKRSPAAISLVSMIREVPEQASSTLLPPPPVIKQRQQNGQTSETQPLHPMSQNGAKGGDLLFFEGLPFRYLEHLEQIPPQEPRQSYKEKFHNMINSIVMESPSWQDPGQYNHLCSV
jgi:hypothetical protein